jgi:hypothetical protein
MTEQSHLKVLWLQSGHDKEYSGFNEKNYKIWNNLATIRMHKQDSNSIHKQTLLLHKNQ